MTTRNKAKTGYEVRVTVVDFDADDESTMTLGVFLDRDKAEEAKVKDMLKYLKTDFAIKKLTESDVEKAVAAFTGKSDNYTVNGYMVTEDELYDEDKTHCYPNYSWSIDRVKVK